MQTLWCSCCARIYRSNLLKAIDYQAVEKQRTGNFYYLHEQLKGNNRLNLTIPFGAYMYPFYCETGAVVSKALQVRNIYIPLSGLMCLSSATLVHWNMTMQ